MKDEKTKKNPMRGFDFDLNLGHSVSRWLMAIGLGVLFLASVFGPMFFSQDAFAPLSAIFFWVALWLGWPGHLQGWKPKAGYVLLQLFFCFTFILLTDWIVPRFYYALIDFRLFKVFCLVLFGFWLKVGYLAFDWIAKRF